MSSVASPEGLIHLGMDTSKNTIVVATLLPGEESPVTDRIFNEEEAIRRLVGRFPDRSVLRAWYEAGPGGYELYRLLASMGVACQVVAPSLIPKGGSDKVKTDKRDSRRLARLGRAGELTPVRVPSPAEEAVRDLARARDAVLADRKRARQRLTAVLMRHGRIWRGASYWTAAHRSWIAAQRFGEPALASAIGHYRAALEVREAELAALEAELRGNAPPLPDEIESAYFALRHTLLGGHVLRSGDRPGLEQETWALLTLYQLLRMAMVTAIETRPGTDPDRASFTTAMEAAKDQLTAARGICPDGPADLPGAIGRAVLATLLPARRPRYSARKVKCATSRYLNRDDGRPAHPAAITAIDIAICTPPVDLKPGRTYRDRSTPRPPRPPGPATRRERITAIITSQPPRDWSGHELAVLLHVKPRNMLTQLGEWARLGFFTRTGFGTYKLNTPPSDTPSTNPPDP